jgi:hypothetical protein
VLRLPSESSDAPFAGCDIDDHGRAAADAVAIAIDRIFEREQRLVRNRLDKAGTEQRNRYASRKHRGVGGDLRLVRVAGHIEQVERFARIGATNSPRGPRLAARTSESPVLHGAGRCDMRRSSCR